MENWGKRAQDNGKEDPLVTLARMDERLKSVGEKLDGYIHANKGNFLALNSKLENVENNLKKEDEKLDKKIDWNTVRVCYGMGGLAVIVFIIEWIGGFKH